MDAILQNAIVYGNNNVYTYSSCHARDLNKWAQRNRSSVLYDASDSLLSKDIIDHMMSAAHDFAQLINL